MFPFDLYPGGGRKPLGLAKGGHESERQSAKGVWSIGDKQAGFAGRPLNFLMTSKNKPEVAVGVNR
jgi:hypothetical protein